MLHRHTAGSIWRGTSAELTASTNKFKIGDICIPSDAAIVKIGDGVHRYSALTSLPISIGVATFLAQMSATTPLTAIGATFADLAAARTAVNTMRSETEARLATLETQVNSLTTKLKTAGLMAGS